MGVGLLTLSEEQGRDARSFYTGRFAKPVEEPGFFTGTFTGPTGIGHAIDIAQAAAWSGLSPELEDPSQDGIAKYMNERRVESLKEMELSRADPKTMGMFAQFGHALGTATGEAIIGLPAFGLPGAVASLGTLTAFDKYHELIGKGVDEDTAKQVAGLSGTVMAAGGGLPAFIGKTLFKQVATAAGMGVGLGVVERGGTAAILESNGYTEMATHYKMLDGTAMLVDGVLNAAFPIGFRLAGIKTGRESPPPSTEVVEQAMKVNEGVVEATRDPATHTTLEGIEAQIAANIDVARQLAEGVHPSDIKIPASLMDDAIPNPDVARVAAFTSKIVFETLESESGINVIKIDSDLATLAKAFKEVDEASQVKSADDAAQSIMVKQATEEPAGARAKAVESDAEVGGNFHNDRAKGVADADPEMKVVNDNNEIVTAKELLGKANEELQATKSESILYKVAVACAIGVGE